MAIYFSDAQMLEIIGEEAIREMKAWRTERDNVRQCFIDSLNCWFVQHAPTPAILSGLHRIEVEFDEKGQATLLAIWGV